MFKYGSFRLFLLKFVFGIILTGFSIVYFSSLISYSVNDPGFNTYEITEEKIKVSNYFGFFGSYLSSYSLVIIGTFSYIFCIFLFIEGVKFIIGYKTKLLVLKFFSNLIGIIVISFLSYKYFENYFEPGLISLFLSELIKGYNYYPINSAILIFIVEILVLIFSFGLILFSYSIKLKYSTKLFWVFKIFKYINLINKLSYFFKKKSNPRKKLFRNEPTIKKSLNLKQRESYYSTNKNLERSNLDQFKYTLPSTDLLIKLKNKHLFNKENEKVNKEAALKLEKTLSEYGVEGNIIGYKSGPIVTLYEFIPSAGIKSSKVIGLSDDIARAMSSLSARISSQPGKTSLGIEIPNEKREGVLFGDLIEEQEFKNRGDNLTLALGKDISGQKIFAQLEKMPHLLIAGTTGSGKSVGINTMILSLLYRFKPNECKLILIDPKMLELSIYEDIPHLLTPVVTDPKKAVFALKWVVREMENRYKLMSSVNVKNIESYNNKVLKTISAGRKLFKEVQTGVDSDTKMPILEKKEIQLEKMPFIVVVIDEMADLMMVAGKEVESLVQRLAQMARASGIHLIMATQRPSVDVITGTIKANFPSRISYKVASKFDSRTILNEMGAEQLLGSGDMLLLENGGVVKRLHGGYVSEDEVEKVVKVIKNQATFDYKKEISLKDIDLNQRLSSDLVSENQDELYNKAVEIVVKQQKVSTSYIQRYLQIGYNRAARIVEKMEEDGFITEANNAGKRDVLKKE